MHKTAVIPARYGSTRLKIKPLQIIAGKTLIHRVYEATLLANIFDRIIIATDHNDIFLHTQTFNAECVMTSPDHQTGTDRIEECCRNIKTDLIVNIQGDEPFIREEPLKILIKAFDDPNVKVASIMSAFKNQKDILDPSCVKVIVNVKSDAIYFSRSVIPFDRDHSMNFSYYKHFGVYAYRPDMLKIFVNIPISNLEQIERLEQLRLIENCYNIRMVITDYEGIGIDTPEDILKAEEIIKKLAVESIFID